MTTTDNELRATDSRCLRDMADNLKADAKAIYPHNRDEAMRLFRLLKRILYELHRRRNPATAFANN